MGKLLIVIMGIVIIILIGYIYLESTTLKNLKEEFTICEDLVGRCLETGQGLAEAVKSYRNITERYRNLTQQYEILLEECYE